MPKVTTAYCRDCDVITVCKKRKRHVYPLISIVVFQCTTCQSQFCFDLGVQGDERVEIDRALLGR